MFEVTVKEVMMIHSMPVMTKDWMVIGMHGLLRESPKGVTSWQQIIWIFTGLGFLQCRAGHIALLVTYRPSYY